MGKHATDSAGWRVSARQDGIGRGTQAVDLVIASAILRRTKWLSYREVVRITNRRSVAAFARMLLAT